jgi:choline dehydrogenase-like flavoprotein
MALSMFMTLMEWTSGLDYKKQVLKYRHTNGFISIARDRDTGRIYPDPVSGTPRIDYTASIFDRAHLMEGVIALAKICYVTGATEIHPCLTGLKPFIRDPDVPSSDDTIDPGVTDARFETWLDEVRQIGNKPPIGTSAVAHQMGTNRMSLLERDGVVDSKGRVWGTKNLYVSDASVFPSASGVNPMVTNMAISDWISRGVSKDLKSTSE